jgi:hypothetical protein
MKAQTLGRSPYILCRLANASDYYDITPAIHYPKLIQTKSLTPPSLFAAKKCSFLGLIMLPLRPHRETADPQEEGA